MNKNNSLNDGNVDIYAIIESLILRKFTLFLFTVIGLLIGYFTVYNDRTNLNHAISLQIANINLGTFTGGNLENNSPDDKYILKEIIEYDFIDRFKYHLMSKKNIRSVLIDQNVITKNFNSGDTSVITNYQNNLKYIDEELSFKENKRLSPNEIKINYNLDPSNKGIVDVEDFLKKLIIQSQKTTITEVIKLFENNLYELENLILKEKKYSKMVIDKRYSENKIKLKKEIENIDAKYFFTIESLKKHISIALELNYDESKFFTDIYDITANTASDQTNIGDVSQLFETDKTILSLSKTSGIPLYMFGYKLLEVELNALEKDKYAQVKKVKKDQLEAIRKYDLMKQDEDYDPEILFFKSVLIESLNKLKSQDYSYFLIDEPQLKFITINEEKIAPNSLLNTLLIGLVFFILSIFVVLYQSETYNRKEN